jgi:hypothetical protein
VARLTDNTPVPVMARVGSEHARSAEPRRKRKHKKLEGKEGIRLPLRKHKLGGHGAAVPRKSRPWPYRGAKEVENVHTGWRRSRRSWRQTQSTNGSAVAELNVGGPSSGVRWRELRLGLLLRWRASARARSEAGDRGDGDGGSARPGGS